MGMLQRAGIYGRAPLDTGQSTTASLQVHRMLSRCPPKLMSQRPTYEHTLNPGFSLSECIDY